MNFDFTQKFAEIAILLGLNFQHQMPFSYPPKSLELDLRLAERDCVLFCGDNFQVLLHLLQSKFNKVDLCYIDPPYNTKNKFIYNDSRIGDAKSIFGVHSAWMSFMLSRLVLAHELISESGFIAISIDDCEQPYMRFLLDKVFGEENFIGNIVVCRSKNGKGSKRGIAVNHDYILVYAKSKKSKVLGLNADAGKYDREDIYGRYKIDGLFRKKGDASKREDRPNMFYPLYYDQDGRVFTENSGRVLKEAWPLDSKGVERRWLWGREKAHADSWKLYASPRGTIYVKDYDCFEKKVKLRSLWSDNRYLTERATNQIKEIYGEKIFETPKPVELIEDLISSHAKKDAVILDFFAGTGTTAHAAHNLNLVDGGSRKVILVEQDVDIAKNHIAFKFGYQYISEITERRLKYLSKIDERYKYSVIKITD